MIRYSKANQIGIIIKAMDDYESNRVKNLKIYESNNSTNLIIKDLKAVSIYGNKTIVISLI